MQGGAKLRITGVLLVVALLAPAMEGVCAAAQSPFVAPITGPITHRFEAPLGPYGPGHRGVDFGAEPGSILWASGDGTVTFAGAVADDGLFITIDHGLGIRTTYSFLSRIDVSAGQEVKQGAVIGLTGEGHPEEGIPALHFGAKLNGVYIDPELLLSSSFDRVRLVALDALDSPIEVVHRDGQDGSLLSPREPISARPLTAPIGILASVGKKLADAGKAAVRTPRNVLDWGRKRIEDGRRLWNRAQELGRKTGAWFSAGWQRLEQWAKAGGKSTQQFLEKVATKLRAGRDRLSRVIDALSSRLTNVIEKGRAAFSKVSRVTKAIKERISKVTAKAKVIKKILKFMSRIKVAISAVVTTFHLGKGVIKQIGCRFGGGGKPPVIPSKDELAKGAKAPPPPNDNIVIAVAGIGSHTSAVGDGTIKANATIYNMDLRTLGYSEDRIFHFSYKGIDERGDGGPYRLHAPYTREDTYQSIRDSAALLARHVESIHKLHPERKIDIVSHSQGGLVAQYYLAGIYDRDRTQAARVGHFVAVATPHKGADAAQLSRQIEGTQFGDLLIDGWDEVSRMTGLPMVSSPAVTEMAEGSDFLQELDKLWDPGKVRTTTIAATFDYVVTSPHTRLRGANHYTANLPTTLGSVFNAHGDVVNARNTKEIIYTALSNNPMACTAFRDAVADHGVGKLLSSSQDFFFTIYGGTVRTISKEVTGR